MCTAELTWYTLKLFSLILMKHTWWYWHAVPGTAYWNRGHTAGMLRKYGCISYWEIIEIYMSYEIFLTYFIEYFFSVQHMVSIFNCNANFAYWEWVIGRAHTLCKCLKWNYKKCLAPPWLSFGILQVLQWNSQITFCWLIQKFVLKFWNLHYFHRLERCVYYLFSKNC